MDALGRKGQTVAANLERVFIVSAVLPELREGLIDRYLVAADRQGIDAEIILNKVDLLDSGAKEDILDRLRVYTMLVWPVHLVSAHSGQGLSSLAAAFADKTSILVGHSGVGKTSLINALCPGVSEKVKEINDATGKGTHTTTTSAMYQVPNGGIVIDSPGIRSFGLWGVSAHALREHFREFVDLQSECRFSDCQHIKEPHIAIRAELDPGNIHPRRYVLQSDSRFSARWPRIMPDTKRTDSDLTCDQLNRGMKLYQRRKGIGQLWMILFWPGQP